MHRGYSDLGHRIKKRVTLSSIPSQYSTAAAPGSGDEHSPGDVVIVVPPLAGAGERDEDGPCLPPGPHDPGSPKTTESTSPVAARSPPRHPASPGAARVCSPLAAARASSSADDDDAGELEEDDEDAARALAVDDDDVVDMDDDDEEEEGGAWDGCEDAGEDTALLRAAAAATAIVVTPISPAASAERLGPAAGPSGDAAPPPPARLVSTTADGATIVDIHKMDLLKPDVIPMGGEDV